MKAFFFNTLWDAFLALVPIVLGYGAASVGRMAREGRVWLKFVLGALLTAWLAFLPNAAYVMTQWRHFLERVDANNVTIQSQNDPQMLVYISTRALFYGCYCAFGMLALTLAIRPVERMLRTWNVPFYRVAPVLFLLLSLGVYLGLIERWNSWDVLLRPRALLSSILMVPSRPTLMAAVVVFAAVLWTIYEAIDLWADGVCARIQLWFPRQQR